jgi:hypothetical protein
MYDARICTASDPCIKPAVGETAQCEGDACQSPPPPPLDQTPASLAFSGAGNVLLGEAPAVVVPPKPRTVAQLRAERLARALKTCRKIKAKRRRVACETQARKSYGALRASRAAHGRGVRR